MSEEPSAQGAVADADSEVDLTRLSAVELRRRLVGGELSAVELLEACLARVERSNPSLNAVCTLSEVAFDDALAVDNLDEYFDRGVIARRLFDLNNAFDALGGIEVGADHRRIQQGDPGDTRYGAGCDQTIRDPARRDLGWRHRYHQAYCECEQIFSGKHSE